MLRLFIPRDMNCVDNGKGVYIERVCILRELNSGCIW